MNKIILLFIISLFTLPPSNMAEEPFKYKVRLTIAADDNIKNEINSYLSRELRKLDDIELTDNEPFFSISIIALSESKGYVISTLVTHPLGHKTLRPLLATKFTEDELKVLFDSFLPDAEQRLAYRIDIYPRQDLADFCRSIVAKIDGNVFEPRRREAETLKQYFKDHPIK